MICTWPRHTSCVERVLSKWTLSFSGEAHVSQNQAKLPWPVCWETLLLAVVQIPLPAVHCEVECVAVSWQRKENSPLRKWLDVCGYLLLCDTQQPRPSNSPAKPVLAKENSQSLHLGKPASQSSALRICDIRHVGSTSQATFRLTW